MVEIPPYVRQVLEQLEAAGHEAWCVGGCVRDSLLGRVPGDWDVPRRLCRRRPWPCPAPFPPG